MPQAAGQAAGAADLVVAPEAALEAGQLAEQRAAAAGSDCRGTPAAA